MEAGRVRKGVRGQRIGRRAIAGEESRKEGEIKRE